MMSIGRGKVSTYGCASAVKKAPVITPRVVAQSGGQGISVRKSQDKLVIFVRLIERITKGRWVIVLLLQYDYLYCLADSVYLLQLLLLWSLSWKNGGIIKEKANS